MWLLSVICIVFSVICVREVSNKIVSKPTPKRFFSIENVEIVGGHDIDIREAPYQVVMLHRGHLLCGGSIIAKSIILTAAHCVKGQSPSDLQVRVGSSSYTNGGLLVPVADLIYHPKFTNTDLDNDVGLLKLQTPLEFSDTVKPIDMMGHGEEIDDGAIIQVSGWGLTQENGLVSTTLQRVSLQKVNEQVCRSEYSDIYNITERMLCAGVPGGGKDACQGDSGGPLVYDGKLAGVVSWGIGCARPTYPGVYAKVSALRTWIDDNKKHFERQHGIVN